MIRKILVVGAVLLFLVSLTACGAPTTSQEQDKTLDQSTGEVEGETTGLGSMGIPDLFGEIKEVVGNEVTLLVIENPEAETDAVPGSGMGRGKQGLDVVREYTGEEVTVLIPVGTTMVKRIPQSGTDQTGTGTGTGPIEEEVGLTELIKGATLKIYYQEGSTTSIEKILVQPPRS